MWARLQQGVEAVDAGPELLAERAAGHLVDEGGRVLDGPAQRLRPDDGREVP